MIARNESSIHFTSLVIGTPFCTPYPEKKFAGSTGNAMPKKRDREVPYGMKGGEH
jgi:hypothetical protein